MSAHLLDLSQSLLIIDAVLAALLICGLGLGTQRLLKRGSAPLRHGVLLAAVVLTLLSPGLVISLAHLRGGWFSVKEVSTSSPLPESKPALTKDPIVRNPTEPQPPSIEENITAQSSPSPKPSPNKSKVRRLAPSPASQTTHSAPAPIRESNEPSITPGGESPKLARRKRPRLSEEPETSASPKTEARHEFASRQNPETSEESRSFLSLSVTAVVLVWMAGTGVCFLRSLRSWWLIGRLFRSRTLVKDPRVKRSAASAARVLKHGSPLRVYTSPLAPVPLSLGWWSNSIVLPVGLADELSDRQLEDIFVHEAAHLVRRDAWIAVLQQLAASLFWWNIFLILINRRLGRLREEICDDYVLAEGGSGRRFAETLVRVAEWSVNRPPLPAGGTSLLSNIDELAERLTHLTKGIPPMSLRLTLKSRLLLLASATTIGLACCLPLVKADDPPKADADNPTFAQETSEAAKEKQAEAERQKAIEEQQRQRYLEFRRASAAQGRKLEQQIRERDLEHLRLIQNRLLDLMVRDGSPGERLFGAFGSFQSWPKTHVVDSNVLRAFAELRTLTPGDFGPDTKAITPEKVAELVKKADGKLLDRFRKAETAYRELSKQPSPLDWSPNADQWYQFAADFLAEGTDEELANRWKQQIKAHPESVDLITLAYLDQIQGRQPKFVDKPILESFCSKDSLTPTERFTRLVLVLAAWDKAGLPRDDKFRESLWTQSLDLLRKKEIRLSRHDQNLRVIARVFADFWQGLKAEEHTAFVNAMLIDQSAFTIQALAGLAGIDPATQRRWFLARPVRGDFQQTPFLDALDFIKDASHATIWQDPAVANWDKKFTMNIEGTWFETLGQLLAKTPFEAALLDDGIVWIGPPAKREASARRLREIKGLIPDRPELQNSVEIEFIETPVKDAFEFLSDANDIPIYYLGEQDIPINLIADANLPLYLVIEMVTEIAGARWDVLGNAVVVAQAKEFPLWQKAIADYRRQQITITRLHLAGNPLVEKFEGRVDVEFIDTPVKDALDFMADATGASIVYLGNSPNAPVRFISSSHFLPAALTLMLAPLDLSWDTDGHMIVVSDRETLSRFRELTARGDEKKRTATAAVRKALAKPVSTILANKPQQAKDQFDAVLKILSQQTGVTIETAQGVRQNWTQQMPWISDVPLETVLDLFAARAQADWKVTTEGHIRLEPIK